MRRKTILATNEIYHIYNRGVEKRPIFHAQNDYLRFRDLVNYYRFTDCSLRFSFFKRLALDVKSNMLSELENKSEKHVEIFTFCLMPNHFHFLLKQLTQGGISKFVSKVTNGYSHYFNMKYKRVGHLFQGNFGAVRIEDEEQFLHVHRYIHLNPVTSYIIDFANLSTYKFSSYPQYLDSISGFCDTNIILSYFKNIKQYKKFIEDQVDYARKLDRIKHVLLE